MRFSKQRTTTSADTPANPASRRMSERFERWSITQRVLLGFGVILTLLSGIGAAGFMSVVQISEIFEDLRTSTDQTAYIGELSNETWIEQISLREYRAAPTKENAAEVLKHLEKAHADEEHITALFGADSATADRLRALSHTADELTLAFNTLTETDDALAELNAEMSRLNSDIRKKLNGLVFAATMSGDKNAPRDIGRGKEVFLDARYSASGFQTTGDQTDFAKAQSTIKESRSIFDSVAARASGGLKDNAAALIVQLDAWSATLSGQAEKKAIKQALLSETLMPLSSALLEGYRSLSNEVLDHQHEVGPIGSAKIIETEAMLAIGVGIALAIGLALAALIGRWITGSISRLSRGIDRLASGDLSIEITGGEHKHEIGSMARAMGVFRDNAKAMERMHAEKAETDARVAAERREMMVALGEAFGVVVDAAVAGDFGKRVSANFPDPELQALAEGVNRLMDTTDTSMNAVVEVIGAVADGDLTNRMNGEFSGAFERLQNDVNRMVTQLSSLVADMQSCGFEISTDSRQIADGSANLSNRAESQAASLEETAATMEEMSATIKTNSDAAHLAAELARGASKAADHGGAVVSDSVKAIRRVEESSNRITDIISVIDGIAFQTNLLALNAAVEAARAGESGKGFAVVASEVRTLAQRSAEAATSVKEIVTESATHVSAGVQAVEEAGRSLETIVDTIRKVSDSVDDISAASVEQAAGVQEVTCSVSAMDTITQQNSALAEQSAATSHRLAEAAARLDEMIRVFTFEQSAIKAHEAA